MEESRQLLQLLQVEELRLQSSEDLQRLLAQKVAKPLWPALAQSLTQMAEMMYHSLPDVLNEHENEDRRRWRLRLAQLHCAQKLELVMKYEDHFYRRMMKTWRRLEEASKIRC